ncbi:ABC efflux pump, inner membrane subunit [Candidatus Koribacter versatilis Ellin345]|uniref:ABC efflux pump, inner membrane subunit n=1 Tax=Koribacter versatilis (strain Ellin345) TaxID=204669 RepID=Q1IKJ0_KORVE|nr:ABC transporter permease [Candidatus Koribacter versatilis]ABF42610.1 ABC efflux pump, inner membrane subunit [Candidatus Koribacter versatilis Ellin345]
MSTLAQDIRYALRQMRLSPGFTVTAILTLAIGIGATTAIFTLINEIMLKSLPVAEPAQLYRIGDTNECCNEGWEDDDWSLFSHQLVRRFAEATPEFEEVTAFQASPETEGVRSSVKDQVARPMKMEFIDGHYFHVLGINPFAGRVIQLSDDQRGVAPVAVMNYATWQQTYGSDPSLIGSTFVIEGHPVTLVGIAPPGFYGDTLRSRPPDFWFPIQQELLIDGPDGRIKDEQQQWLYAIGRLKPGASVQGLDARLTTVLQHWLSDEDPIPAVFRTMALTTVPHKFIKMSPAGSGIASMKSNYSTNLRILLLVCLTVLLIACANIANLLLARSTARRGHTAMRMALGATRTRLIRQQLTEAVTLAVCGGLLGTLVAFGGARLMLALAFPQAKASPISATPSWPVLGFAFALSLLTGIIFGVVPAWFSSHSDPAEALRGANRSTKDHATLPQKLLVIAQAAMSLGLLACAGLLTQSLLNLQRQDFGFVPENRVIVSMNPPSPTHTVPQLTSLYRSLQDRLSQIPGVQGVSFALYSPMEGNNWGELVAVEGRGEPKANMEDAASWDRVSSNYLPTIGQQILRGRNFQSSDSGGHPVAIINEAFAKTFFPGEDPMGKHFGMDAAKFASMYEIVGIARNAKYGDPSEPARPFFYVSLEQSEHADDPLMQMMVVRSHFMQSIQLLVGGNVENIEPQIRRAVAEIDPTITLISVQTMHEQVASNFNQERMVANLAGIFGGIALLLAAIGLYGMTAYSVVRRTAEIGVRMALGANRLNIVQMVLRGAFVQVAIGLVLGIPLAMFAGHFMASKLFQVRAYDPLVLGGSIVALALCAAIASILPARRAASTEPMKALRTE